MIAETRVFRVAPNRIRGSSYAMLFLAVTPFILMAIVTYQLGMLKDRMAVGMLVISPILIAFAAWADIRYRNTARLTVDPAGIRMESDLPKFLGLRFDIRWEDIWKVTLVERMGLLQIRRRGFTAPPPSNVRLRDWYEEGTAPAPKPPALKEAPLYKLFEEIGLFRAFLPEAGLAAMNFDLAKHPATKVAMAVMAGLAAYWALDSFLAKEAWAEWSGPYIAPHAVVGVLAAIAAGLALKGAKKPEPVPLNITLVVAGILGFTAALASWTGLIRVNQSFGGPLIEQSYVRNESCNALVPVNRGLPSIEYTDQAKHYWCQFPRDYRHVVPVRQGLGGLYQVDLTKHTAAIREYRARQGK
jgi:hypothetical protein